MEKYLIAGKSQDVTKIAFLTFPAAKHYEVHAIKNGEPNLDVETLLGIAVSRKKSDIFHIYPEKAGKVALPRTLQHVLTRYPYPLSQGPVVLPTDCLTTENYENDPFICKTVSEVLTAQTVFTHEETQECYEWHPTSSGVSAWGSGNPSYEVRESSGPSLIGPASTLKMGVMYTCQFSRCLLNCPCTICTDDRKTCKRLCKVEICRNCNAQCLEHEIKLPRLFNAVTDHYMIVTDFMNKYKHAYAYAGIPLTCISCSRDVEEHQLLHLVWHARCRYCRLQMRPVEWKSVVDIEDYEAAEKVIKNDEKRTCSFCLVQSQDSFARRKHEDTVHRKIILKYKCDQCDKSFSNKNALQFHNDKHIDLKVACDVCGFQSSSSSNLAKHKLIHSTDKQVVHHVCEDCNKTFSNENNLKRHKKEYHYENNTNLNFVEDMDEAKLIKCEHCGDKFKRKSHLKRHEESLHGAKKKSFQCPNCDKVFSRKDNMCRHIKSNH